MTSSMVAGTEQKRASPASELHVLHVVSGDLWAGAEVQVWQLLRAAVREPGLKVSAVVLNPGRLADELSAAGVAVQILDEGQLSFIELARALISHVRETLPQVIHTHRRKEHLLGAIAAKLTGVGLVGTAHGRNELLRGRWDMRQRLLHLLEQATLAACHDRLIAVADDMIPELPGPATHKVIIPNGIDRISLLERACAPLPEQLQEGRTRLLFLGRLAPVKQVEHLIEMIDLLETRAPGTYALDIVGDGPERAALEKQASKLNNSCRIRFHGFQANPLPMLAQAGALLFASAHEGLPMTALEALSLGTPIVTPPLPSLARLVNESGHGAIALSSSAERLADAVMELALPQTPGVKTCRLPDRYAIEETTGSTVALWRQVSGLRADSWPRLHK